MHEVERTRIIHIAAGAAAAAACALACAPLVAQPYPSKAIRLIVPFPPGGPVDTLARIVSQQLAPRLGQQIVVDNRAGANGIIGTEMAATAPPDGYTLLLGNVGPIAANISLYRKLPYDPVRSFAPIAMIAVAPQILVAHPSLPARSVPELIRVAKARPGQLAYGSPGKGSGAHLSMELFKTQAGIDVVHVPYKGAVPALTDLLGGQISLVLSSILPAQPLVSTAKLIGLAVTSRQRSPALPLVPTMAESGLADFEAIAWFGVLAPAGIPHATIASLNRELSAAMRAPEVRQQLVTVGSESVSGTPEQFAGYIRSEIAKWREVIHNAGIKPQ